MGNVQRPGQGGQAMVELAFVLPLLLLLILGALAFGLMLNAKLVVTGAAREGARSAAILWANQLAGRRPDLGAVRRQVAEQVAGALAGGGLPLHDGRTDLFDPKEQVTVVPSLDGDVLYITVAVRYRQPTYIPLLARLVDADAGGENYIALVSAATFRVESPGLT